MRPKLLKRHLKVKVSVTLTSAQIKIVNDKQKEWDCRSFSETLGKIIEFRLTLLNSR